VKHGTEGIDQGRRAARASARRHRGAGSKARSLFDISCLFIFCCLAACAPVRVREGAGGMPAQLAREAQLAGEGQWQLQAHLGVSDGKDGGSGELTWRQDGERYDFGVRAPVTGRSWRLHGDARGATLEGVREAPAQGRDAGEVLDRELGWHVPMAELRYWVRGLRAPAGAAEVRFGADGLPAEIRQGGWTVQYRDWFAERSPPLPRKVFATRGAYRVRLSIQDWHAP
jgi:outer membrane lipoprotein LolB